MILIFSYLSGFVISHFLCKFCLSFLFKSVVFDEIEDRVIKNFNLSQTAERIFPNFFGGNNLSSTVGSKMMKIFLSRIIFVILFFFIFSFFRVVKRYILKITKITRKIPIIGVLDGFLGAICGVFKAFLFLFVSSIVFFIIIVLTKDELPFLNVKLLNSTCLFFLFYKITYFLK